MIDITADSVERTVRREFGADLERRRNADQGYLYDVVYRDGELVGVVRAKGGRYARWQTANGMSGESPNRRAAVNAILSYSKR